MTQAHHIVRLNRPIEEVFDFLADGTNNPRWQRFVVRTAPSNDAVGVGHTFSQRVRHPLGFTVPADFRVTEYERPRRLSVMVTAGGPIRPTITYELTPDGEVTILRCTVEHQLAGVARLAAPATALLHPVFAWEARSVERIGRCLESATQEAA